MHLSEAIGLVRGEPLAEFAEFPFARDEIPRLDELRLGTIEEYYDALLTAGEAAELVPALEQLVEENPYRERLRGQLMLALYRAGRQTDALARYQEGRRLLADEVGIEPSPRLRELERAILQHDADLMPAPRKNGGAARAGEPPPPPQRRRRWLIPALVALLALAAGAIAVVLTQTGRSAGLSSLPRDSVGVVDANSGTLEKAIQLHGVPVDLTGSGRRVWVAMGEPHRIGEIDPSDSTLAKTLPLPFVPRRIGPGNGGVWIAGNYNGTIARLDASSGQVGQPVSPFGDVVARISFATRPGTLWVAADRAREAANLDPRTGRVVGRRRGLHSPVAIATGFGALWLASGNRAVVERVRGRDVHPIAIGSLPVAVATGGKAVWAVSPSTGTLTRISPKQVDVSHVSPIGGYPTSVAYGGGFVWVGLEHGGSVARVNPRTNEVQTIHVGRPVAALCYYDGRLWVAAG
jgi:streptogramin lyase